ncbi:Elongation Factor G domain-containing protein [Caenorhabditis elegans]|uniref:Elongation Factor G domain-containing protein n=1 Tax=Caenorhabditis elegans TaxID=6239 RepID=O62278_CAEEL|nr:Elongation Factor G domain-containing protein [Caenorhabditis elegans]CAB04527.1 Elongation Factor G domain-containing protein [Caenorhabditis elegans]|eukprot:NP_496753.1 Uncharacterized protein CELE_F58G1.8 [Caenorhabditis elegans]
MIWKRSLLLMLEISVQLLDLTARETFSTDQNLAPHCEPIHIPEPAISVALKSVNRKDADNFIKALTRFTKEEPTFRIKLKVQM